jgi:hypothetical protein
VRHLDSANAWYDAHPRAALLIDAGFAIVFWALGALGGPSWIYGLALVWTIRTIGYDWWWRIYRNRVARDDRWQ